MKLNVAGAVVALSAMCFVGCASRHEEGVKSNLRTQSADVNADVTATTDAAEQVLNDRELRGVQADATKVDGSASGKLADGTMVKVAIEKETDDTSEVSVTVGKIGDPKLGAEIARAIKTRAEGGGTGTAGTRSTTRRSGM